MTVVALAKVVAKVVVAVVVLGYVLRVLSAAPKALVAHASDSAAVHLAKLDDIADAGTRASVLDAIRAAFPGAGAPASTASTFAIVQPSTGRIVGSLDVTLPPPSPADPVEAVVGWIGWLHVAPAYEGLGFAVAAVLAAECMLKRAGMAYVACWASDATLDKLGGKLGGTVHAAVVREDLGTAGKLTLVTKPLA